MDLLAKSTRVLLREFLSTSVLPDAHHPGQSRATAAAAAGNDHELGSRDNEGSFYTSLEREGEGSDEVTLG